MKLASLKNGRDGRLIVVSRDLSRFADASAVAPTLQAALDDWDSALPRLTEIADGLESGRLANQPFDPAKCASPLPRAYQWLDGSAYVNHVALVRQARGAEVPETFWTDPLMYQGISDVIIGPRDPILLADEAYGIDLEAEVVVVLGDVPMGATREQAVKAIKLIMLVNDVSLRNLIPAELAKTFGFLQSKPSSAFSPVAVTPDELGKAWDGAKVDLPLLSFINGQPLGKPVASVDMTFDFPTLIMHATKTRALSAGTILGAGTVSNRDANGGPGKTIADGGLGYSCLAEQRTVETILHGKPSTPFLKFGDRVRIEMNDKDGKSIFGAIDHEVVRYTPPK
ncbi:fumarylacetoacetate hydrolase family protein [Pseudorhodoplanes sinuspersici]|uniref:2-keto-4-pentenoate hydratase n=1 Tax=Pseudorhodoplanes sinuspersici TaxID=1235591 RepID=A0A1W6ZVG6_9HYPH|nr:fumarylacetoacetate hydrolase family protein [Pseudorhodoplanes sinuspersici]ARQ01121.1 2-keto-4-pentenoate hydratase [Pseudorhodoplanes sinuspersici]RKE72770.1 fumarylacetoacetate (FAA) hydrolase [Pseudorhodoplanes sinuspersici]